MKHKKVVIIIILIVLWCSLIFFFSSKNNLESNSTSKEVITLSLKSIVSTTNKLKITNIDLTGSWLETTVKRLNYPIRKLAHLTIYFILGIFIFVFFKILDLKNFQVLLLSIILCFCYSLTDEYHQTFVSDRTGQFSDCLIDTLGATISTSVLYLAFKKKDKKAIINN